MERWVLQYICNQFLEFPSFLYIAIDWKNSITKRTIFWSSEPENITIRPMLWYGPQNYTSIGETAIQVRWYDNTMYSDCKQNIMPSLSLLWIFACDKTIRHTQKWSLKERKNAPNKSTNASKKWHFFLISRLESRACEAMHIHFEVRVACMRSNAYTYICQLWKNLQTWKIK